MSKTKLNVTRISVLLLVYLRKSVNSNPRRVIERLTAIQKSGGPSFVVEEPVYSQGLLKSLIILNLEKD